MIPYGRHFIDEEDIQEVINVLKDDWLTGGPSVDAFEEKLKKIVKSSYAVSCSNGTTALHLAMMALGISKNDVVLVPAITFLASANAARYVGADVSFVDVDPKTGLMTAQTLEDAILKNSDKRLKAVVNVHLCGQCNDLEKIYEVSKKYNLKVIEDAAHAIGTTYSNSEGKEHPIGANAYSDLTTFSFHPVKTIAMGEGGAVTTKDPELFQKLKLLRSHGMVKDSSQWSASCETGTWYYEMHDLGYNYRISDINCALGLSQLQKLDSFKKKRQELVNFYDKAFNGNDTIVPLYKHEFSKTAWHLYVVFLPFAELGISRETVMQELKAHGIGTQVHYIPLYHQPYYKKLYGQMTLAGAEKYYATCLSLPLYVGVTEEQIIFIKDLLNGNIL